MWCRERKPNFTKINQYSCNLLSGVFETRVQLAAETFLLTKQRNYMYYQDFPFILDRKRGKIGYYRCIKKTATGCKARLIIKQINEATPQTTLIAQHNHSNLIGNFIEANWDFQNNFANSNIFLAFLWWNRYEAGVPSATQTVYICKTLQNSE